jgi:hypothetical protein
VGDLAKWDENFYTAKVGGKEFIDAMLKPGMLNSGKAQTYASGLSLGQYKGRDYVGHSGSDAGYRAYFFRIPEEHFSVIVLANAAGINPVNLSRKVTDLFLPSKVGDANNVTTVKIVDTATIVKWAGDYYDRTSKGRMKIEASSPGFVNSGTLTFDGDALRPVNDSEFVHPLNGVEYHFHAAVDGIRVILKSQGLQDQHFEKVKKVAVSLAGLEEYAGNYYSKELDVRYSLFVGDNMLQVKTPRHEAEELNPFIRDVFTGMFVVEFQRDKKGKVVGFLVSTGRSRNIRFERL